MAKTIKAVFDTNVSISAILWTGIPHRLLYHIEQGKLRCYATSEILHELHEVLQRSKFTRRITELRTSVDEIMLNALNTFNVVSKTKVLKLASAELPKDEDDAMFIECALIAGANYLVSGDPDLLDLKQVRTVRILTPADFLSILEFERF